VICTDYKKEHYNYIQKKERDGEREAEKESERGRERKRGRERERKERYIHNINEKERYIYTFEILKNFEVIDWQYIYTTLVA